MADLIREIDRADLLNSAKWSAAAGFLQDEHIDSVVDLYLRRETVKKETFLASFEDIEKNDFNLNIPRYVDNFEKEEEIDLVSVLEVV